MKKKICYVILSAIILVLGCNKEDYKINGTSNINLINATVGLGAVKINLGMSNGFKFSKAVEVPYGSSNVFGTFTGNHDITVLNSLDSTNILFRRSINLGPINTLYLSGKYPNVDTLFHVEKNIPYISTSSLVPDNSIFIRFVNLSQNSTPLKISIRLSNVIEVDNFVYKNITEFKKYSAPITLSNYTFEVRDLATNTLQTSYRLSVNSNRFKTIALIVKGVMGVNSGVDSFSIFQVNYI